MATAINPNGIKKKFLQAYFAGKTINCALFRPAAALTSAYATYSTTNECPTGNGYTQGGKAVTGLNYSADGVSPAWADWDVVEWLNTTFTAGVNAPRYAVLYDVATNDVIAISDFGSEQTCTSATFTVTMPETGSGVVRLS